MAARNKARKASAPKKAGRTRKRAVEPVTVIVPVRDEADNLDEFLPLVRPYADELLVVDGHSTDGSREIASKHADRVVLDGGRGKGDALRCGVNIARHDIIVFIDADFSHDPEEIPLLTAPIRAGDAMHVQGSRMLGGSDELFHDFPNYVRLFGSVIITMGINFRFKVRITDSQNGFRAIRKKFFLELDTQEESTTIEQEMIIKTFALGHQVIEVPAHESARRGGQSKIHVRRVWPRYVYSWLKYLTLS
ncbi:MAG: glycosyltransferase family 2 protein [Myxococcota bacterium]